jgi:hypothetical protein
MTTSFLEKFSVLLAYILTPFIYHRFIGLISELCPRGVNVVLMVFFFVVPQPCIESLKFFVLPGLTNGDVLQ